MSAAAVAWREFYRRRQADESDDDDDDGDFRTRERQRFNEVVRA